MKYPNSGLGAFLDISGLNRTEMNPWMPLTEEKNNVISRSITHSLHSRIVATGDLQGSVQMCSSNLRTEYFRG